LVLFHDKFEPELSLLPRAVRLELIARLQVVAAFGPALGRPNVDTLSGSSFANMKQLRFRKMGFGVSHSLLIQIDKRWFSPAETRRERTKRPSTPN